MNWNLLAIFIFYIVVLAIILLNKKKFEIRGITAIYRSKIGLKAMDRWSKKCPKVWDFFGYIAIIIGFAGMFLLVYELSKNLINIIFIKEAQSAVSLVLPGMTIPGIGVLNFWYWLIVIFIVATTHEFSHGIMSRRYGIKVKSSGLLFFGPILAAFVEPDEKKLQKHSKRKQLAIFAAGPFVNIALGIIIILLANFIMVPIVMATHEYDGVTVYSLSKGAPANLSGMKQGEIIRSINGIVVKDTGNFTAAIRNMPVNKTILVKTDNRTYSITTIKNPKNETLGYIGIEVLPHSKIKSSLSEKYGNFIPLLPFYVFQFLQILVLLSIGLGIMNLIPIGPFDGGRMLQVSLLHFFKKTIAIISRIK